ncbi:hypothetical protein L596_012633 [Steinernema carpocapsae]|uniref:Uncharacterized protein n=1 Tax=Steinernema carpocapsae TaxID=34508 RepID=A0A4U5NXS8_STECR|nr:hypothetical protein L596_012633 [Steinernema carpocapsae]
MLWMLLSSMIPKSAREWARSPKSASLRRTNPAGWRRSSGIWRPRSWKGAAGTAKRMHKSGAQNRAKRTDELGLRLLSLLPSARLPQRGRRLLHLLQGRLLGGRLHGHLGGLLGGHRGGLLNGSGLHGGLVFGCLQRKTLLQKKQRKTLLKFFILTLFAP